MYFTFYTSIYYALNFQNIIDSDFVYAQAPLSDDINSISLVIQPPLNVVGIALSIDQEVYSWQCWAIW